MWTRRRTLQAAILLTLLAAGSLTAQPADRPVTETPTLPPEIAAFRQQLWSKKPAGQTFRLAVSDDSATRTARWLLAEVPELPFSEPEVRLVPGGVQASAFAEVLGQRVRVEGRARIVLVRGRPEPIVEDLQIAGVEAPGLLLDAVQGMIATARESVLDFSKIPLRLDTLEIRQGSATIAGVFQRLNKSHWPPDEAAPSPADG